MNIENISSYSKSILIQAGWTPDRQVSTDDWLDHLKAEGIAKNDEGIRFLEYFGGLRFDPPENSNGLYHPEESFFDPVDANNFDVVRAWMRKLGQQYFPLGSIWGDRAVLVISDDGKYYGISDCGLHFIGEDVASLFHVIIDASKRDILLHES